MSMAKRRMETLPEFDEVVEVDDVDSERKMQTWLDTFLGWRIPIEALNPEDAALVRQVAIDDFEDDDEPAIEDDYTWIRTGC